MKLLVPVQFVVDFLVVSPLRRILIQVWHWVKLWRCGKCKTKIFPKFWWRPQSTKIKNIKNICCNQIWREWGCLRPNLEQLSFLFLCFYLKIAAPGAKSGRNVIPRFRTANQEQTWKICGHVIQWRNRFYSSVLPDSLKKRESQFIIVDKILSTSKSCFT